MLAFLMGANGGVVTYERSAGKFWIAHRHASMDQGPMPDEHISTLWEKNTGLKIIGFQDTVQMVAIGIKNPTPRIAVCKD